MGELWIKMKGCFKADFEAAFLAKKSFLKISYNFIKIILFYEIYVKLYYKVLRKGMEEINVQI